MEVARYVLSQFISRRLSAAGGVVGFLRAIRLVIISSNNARAIGSIVFPLP